MTEGDVFVPVEFGQATREPNFLGRCWSECQASGATLIAFTVGRYGAEWGPYLTGVRAKPVNGTAIARFSPSYELRIDLDGHLSPDGSAGYWKRSIIKDDR